MRQVTLAAVLTAMLASLPAGCASPQARGAASLPAAPVTRADMVARLLVAAEQAANAPDPQPGRLAEALAALDRLGARPAPGATDSLTDPLPGWRTSAPNAAVPTMRGRLLGPAYRRGHLEPGATTTLAQLFDGGRQARVAIAAAGGGPLGIAVLDGTGKPVCPVRQGTGSQCSWVPPFSGRHHIRLSNPGAMRVAYYLVIE
ncbi:hypothetical protein SLG_02240 [Sphingobium sp. SYK-6]|uniref:hypothetical protein n=1 Tax=Sphingobium sp. (strain NBRC 103272 / SYK-6) TaxID=627192 RepID=UPI0002276C44|nr:hypothetical protein [Sphingobium sp. SYK-6]BAK64899.1 hypothetical protein SLG_02240 [Sphingobium sp. SYK-6]